MREVRNVVTLHVDVMPLIIHFLIAVIRDWYVDILMEAQHQNAWYVKMKNKTIENKCNHVICEGRIDGDDCLDCPHNTPHDYDEFECSGTLPCQHSCKGLRPKCIL